MTLAVEPELPLTADIARQASPLARLGALVAGVVVLGCGVVVSAGGVALALVGMAVVAYVQRRRGDRLTRTGHWVTACATMAIVTLLVAAALLGMAPKGTVANVMHAADSSSAVAARQPPPAWLERFSPGYRAQQARMEPSSRLIAVLSAIFGIGFALSFFATIYGSLGWGAGMLLGLAAHGRWPGAPPSPDETLAESARASVGGP